MAERPERAEIEKRAHELWEEEGRPHGREAEHWLRAERELAARPDGPDPEAVPPAPEVGDPPQMPPAPEVGDPPQAPPAPDDGETHDPTPPTRSVAGGPGAVKSEAASADPAKADPPKADPAKAGAAAATAGIDAGASASRARKSRKVAGN